MSARAREADTEITPEMIEAAQTVLEERCLGDMGVTPAMLRAAREVLSRHYMGEMGYDLRDPVLRELYRAMRRRARRR